MGPLRQLWWSSILAVCHGHYIVVNGRGEPRPLSLLLLRRLLRQLAPTRGHSPLSLLYPEPQRFQVPRRRRGCRSRV